MSPKGRSYSVVLESAKRALKAAFSLVRDEAAKQNPEIRSGGDISGSRSRDSITQPISVYRQIRLHTIADTPYI